MGEENTARGLNDAIDLMENLFGTAEGSLQGIASQWLDLLIVLEMGIFGITMAYQGVSLWRVIKKFLVIGIVISLLNFAPSITAMITDAFVVTGTRVGAGPGSGVAVIGGEQYLLRADNPGAIVRVGVAIFFSHLNQDIGIFNSGPVFIEILLAIFGILIFLILAYQATWFIIENLVVRAFLIFFLPFSVSPKTNFLFSQALGSFLVSSTKLMGLSFATSFLASLLSLMEVPSPGESLKAFLYYVFIVVAFLLIILKVPQVVAQMASGSASLEGNTRSAGGMVGGLAGAAAGVATYGLTAIASGSGVRGAISLVSGQGGGQNAMPSLSSNPGTAPISSALGSVSNAVRSATPTSHQQNISSSLNQPASAAMKRNSGRSAMTETPPSANRQGGLFQKSPQFSQSNSPVASKDLFDSARQSPLASSQSTEKGPAANASKEASAGSMSISEKERTSSPDTDRSSPKEGSKGTIGGKAQEFVRGATRAGVRSWSSGKQIGEKVGSMENFGSSSGFGSAHVPSNTSLDG